MANLMTATQFVKQEILNELRNGNLDVLKDLPPVMAMSYGIALQNEAEAVSEVDSVAENATNE